jgi:small subunit ribosomal protein S20
MANHISSLKRARQTETKTAVNRANKSKLRGTLRSLREAIGTGDLKIATDQYRATVSLLDKGVQKGTLHSNTASRYKSRLNARLKAVATKTPATDKPAKAKTTKPKVAKAKAVKA